MDPWVRDAAAEIARSAERELEALVGVSSPWGDRRGAEEAVSLSTSLLPADAEVERPPSSSPDSAPDLLARLPGQGRGRVLLLGHLDTVVPHSSHRPLERQGERLVGTGAVDMKGGVVLALGVLRALAGSPHAFAEAALLLVTDEEWRTVEFSHASRFDGFEACLCFEVGEGLPGGEEAVIVGRKAAGTLRVDACGAPGHAGSGPERGGNAVMALAAAAERVAACHDPEGAEGLNVVPTVLRAGEAFNVVAADGELMCDLRADRVGAFEAVVAAVPEAVDGATLEAGLLRRLPEMDTREATGGLLERAGERLERPIVGVERSGTSDANHLAGALPCTVDGLGPQGGTSHVPEEWVLADSLRSRAEVALTLVAAVLEQSDGPGPG